MLNKFILCCENVRKVWRYFSQSISLHLLISMGMHVHGGWACMCMVGGDACTWWVGLHVHVGWVMHVHGGWGMHVHDGWGMHAHGGWGTHLHVGWGNACAWLMGDACACWVGECMCKMGGEKVGLCNNKNLLWTTCLSNYTHFLVSCQYFWLATFSGIFQHFQVNSGKLVWPSWI